MSKGNLSDSRRKGSPLAVNNDGDTRWHGPRAETQRQTGVEEMGFIWFAPHARSMGEGSSGGGSDSGEDVPKVLPAPYLRNNLSKIASRCHTRRSDLVDQATNTPSPLAKPADDRRSE